MKFDLKPGYRTDVDGLRGLAVLGVLLFHLDNVYFPGGFVGVDVFFVISGFVITQTIWKQIQEEKFSLKKFYQKRARRLLPAYLVMLVLTMIGAYYILSPSDLERFGGAVTSALGFVSNFYFWSEAGYFDVEALSKPLLHTWSLAVEAQFYLIYPFLLLYGIRKRTQKTKVITFLTAIILFTLLSQWFVGRDTEGAFFLTPFRFFEFFLGGLLVFFRSPTRSKMLPTISMILGLGLIGWSYITYSDEMLFPGFAALLPALGATMLIYAGSQSKLSKLYDNRPMVWIGKISYSLYLVHWPLIVFFAYKGLDTPEHKVLLLFLSFVGAIAMYYLIEQRFRYPKKPQEDRRKKRGIGFPQTAIVTSVCIGILGLHMWNTGGWVWRYQNQSQGFKFDAHKLMGMTFEENSPEEDFDTDTHNILVFGDSHAKRFELGVRSMQKSNIRIRKLPLDDACFHAVLGLPPKQILPPKVERRCKGVLRRDVLNKPEVFDTVDVIVFFSFWNTQNLSEEHLAQIIDLVRERVGEREVKIVIAGKGPGFDPLHRRTHDLVSQGYSVGEINSVAFEHKEANRNIELNTLLKHIAQEKQATFLDIDNIVCPNTACDWIGPDGEAYFSDPHHWSDIGGEVFVKRIMERYPDVFQSTHFTIKRLFPLNLNTLRTQAVRGPGGTFQTNYLSEEFLPDTHNILLLGDSHASRFVTSLDALNLPGIRKKKISFDDGCFHIVLDLPIPQNASLNGDKRKYCENVVKKRLYQDPEIFKNADVILLFSRWSSKMYSADHFRKIIQLIDGQAPNSAEIYVVGGGVYFDSMHKNINLLVNEGKSVKQINARSYQDIDIDQMSPNTKIQALAQKQKVGYIDNFGLVCVDEKCDYLGPGGTPYFHDPHHWTIEGGKVFVKRMMKQYPEIFGKE